MEFIDLLERAWWASAYAWRNGKDWVELGAPVGNLMLHVLAGTLIFFVALFAWKRSPRWLIAWAMTLAFAVWNELVDITTERWPDVTEQLAEGGFDIAVTMAIPSLLLATWGWPRRARSTPPDLANADIAAT